MRCPDCRRIMGIRAQKNGDRIRTVWTPEMDRFFIDLMLEHVRKGNRIDETSFSKQAWKQMVLSFNSKFKSEYEKDVLKNRHKTLRNLYRAVKGLVSCDGFMWDGVRHMVVAEDSVWEEYIKAHPDTRSFRIKTIPYYGDLCTIYEKAYSEEAVNEAVGGCHDVSAVDTDGVLNEEPDENVVFSLTSPEIGAEMADDDASRNAEGGDLVLVHETMIDGDYSLCLSTDDLDVKPLGETNTTSSSKSTRTRTYWQPPMDRYFVDLMLEQVRKGNQVDGVFRKHAWADMISQFNAKFRFKYDIDILKNRYKTLRKQYKVIRKLLETDGFRWDDTRQMVAADDHVWQEYTKEHIDARQFMTRPLPYYKDLCTICSDLDSGDTNDFWGRTICPPSSERDDPLVPVKVDQIRSPKSIHELEDANLPNPKKTCLEIDRFSADEPTIYSSSGPSTDQEMSYSLSIEHVVQAVQSLPGMDEDLILDSCDLLEDEKKAKTFLALDLKLRKKWLMRKLRPQQLLMISPSDIS